MQLLRELAGYLTLKCLLIVTLMYGIYCTVILRVESDPAVFGQPVYFLCRKLNTSENCIINEERWWMADTDTLMLNGHPYDTSERYTEQVRSCSDLLLRINNFTERDVNREYCCSIGFDEGRLYLSLSSANFEYHPSNQSIESNITLSSQSVSLSVDIPKIYPKPNCTALYDDISLNQSLTQTSNHFDLLYSTNLHLDYTFPSEICPVMVDVNCLVGRTYFLILREEFHNCSNNNEVSSFQGFLLWTIFISFVVIFCMILVFLSLIRNREKIKAMLSDLPKRKCIELRRPILGLSSTVSLIPFLLFLEITTVSNVTEIHEKVKLIIVVLMACILMTPVSLSCISNPDTISIREGMVNAWKRCIQKFKGIKQIISNSETKEKPENEKFLNNSSSDQSHRQKKDDEESLCVEVVEHLRKESF